MKYLLLSLVLLVGCKNGFSKGDVFCKSAGAMSVRAEILEVLDKQYKVDLKIKIMNLEIII